MTAALKKEAQEIRVQVALLHERARKLLTDLRAINEITASPTAEEKTPTDGRIIHIVR